MTLLHSSRLRCTILLLLILSCGSNDTDNSATSCPASLVIAANSGNIYRHGGSAMAYKQHAPISNTICSNNSKYYKLAYWPFSRSSYAKPPQLHLRINLWSCSSAAASQQQEQACSCHLLDNTNDGFIEAWQANSEGVYSSLRENNGDCRARLPLNTTSSLEFYTLAPGSTGSLNGLGPAVSV